MRPVVLLDPWPRLRRRIFSDDQWARLQELAEIVEAGEGAMAADLVDLHLPRAAAVIGQTALPAERLGRAPLLRAVINVEGNFYPNIDYPECFRRGIAVLSIAPAFAVPVAEMALGMAIDLARGITTADRAMREGREVYGSAGNLAARQLSGATVGLIGYGNIGRALRRLLQGFHARVLVHDPWLPDGAVRDEQCEPTGLEALLGAADVVFILAGVTADNGGFLGRAEFAAMRPGTAVVLASRAGVVDFDAFRAAAESGHIRAATDVFPVEPVPPDDPVRRSPLLLSAHRAGGTPAALYAIGELVLDDLALILRGLPPVRLQPARAETIGRLRSPPARTYAQSQVRPT